MTPLNNGTTEGVVPDLKAQREEFYKENKWDSRGYPTEERLKELGLENETKYIS